MLVSSLGSVSSTWNYLSHLQLNTGISEQPPQSSVDSLMIPHLLKDCYHHIEELPMYFIICNIGENTLGIYFTCYFSQKSGAKPYDSTLYKRSPQYHFCYHELDILHVLQFLMEKSVNEHDRTRQMLLSDVSILPSSLCKSELTLKLNLFIILHVEEFQGRDQQGSC